MILWQKRIFTIINIDYMSNVLYIYKAYSLEMRVPAALKNN